MKNIIRKIIIWGLLLILIPNFILGEVPAKIFSLIVIGLLIWWDTAASKKSKKYKSRDKINGKEPN